MFKRITALIVVLLLAVSLSSSAFAYPYNSYSVSIESDVLLAPNPTQISKVLTGVDLKVGAFKEPSLIRMDEDQNLYIADTGNNRIVCFDSKWNFKFEIKNFQPYEPISATNAVFTDSKNEFDKTDETQWVLVKKDGKELEKKDQVAYKKDGENFLKPLTPNFNSPRGIFVSYKKEIYVADTQNKRVVVFDINGNFLRIMPHPESDILDKNFNYLPVNLVVDKTNRMYVLSQNQNKGIMEFDSDGKFVGFMGASRVIPNMVQVMLDRFSTQDQIDRRNQFVPTEYSSISLDHEGFIFVTTNSVTEELILNAIKTRSKDERGATIRKLNAKGVDVLARNGFAPPVGDPVFLENYKITTQKKGPSRLTDISMLDNGLYAALDSLRGRIFTYDSEGNLLHIFGGISETYGGFRYPVSMVMLNGKYIVLDMKKNALFLFDLTEYGQLINDAVNTYYRGEYHESKALWNRVLELNGNCDLAYRGLGMVALRDKEYKQATEYFKLAQNKEYYSKAFDKYRAEVVEKYFTPVAITLLILILFSVTYRIIRKRSKKRREILEKFERGEALFNGRV